MPEPKAPTTATPDLAGQLAALDGEREALALRNGWPPWPHTFSDGLDGFARACALLTRYATLAAALRDRLAEAEGVEKACDDTIEDLGIELKAVTESLARVTAERDALKETAATYLYRPTREEFDAEKARADQLVAGLEHERGVSATLASQLAREREERDQLQRELARIEAALVKAGQLIPYKAECGPFYDDRIGWLAASRDTYRERADRLAAELAQARSRAACGHSTMFQLPEDEGCSACNMARKLTATEAELTRLHDYAGPPALDELDRTALLKTARELHMVWRLAAESSDAHKRAARTAEAELARAVQRYESDESILNSITRVVCNPGEKVIDVAEIGQRFADLRAELSRCTTCGFVRAEHDAAQLHHTPCSTFTAHAALRADEER